MNRPRLLIGLTILFLAIWHGLRTRQDHTRPQIAYRSQVAFPLRGYFLVNERDELSWYRVAVPENAWTKIASGSFMLADEFSFVTDGDNYFLSKTEGKQIHQVDVRTGKSTFLPLPAVRNIPAVQDEADNLSTRPEIPVPEGNIHYLADVAGDRIYFLNPHDALECWKWSRNRLIKERSWRLPPTDSDEGYSRLVIVLNQEWIICETLTEKLIGGFLATPLRPKYYAFNLRTNQWALIVDPPGNHRGEVVAWISR